MSERKFSIKSPELDEMNDRINNIERTVNSNKNNITLLIITLVVGFTCCALVFISSMLNYYKNPVNDKNSSITVEEEYELLRCPICGSMVKLYPVNESWYIQCTNDHCDIRTGYSYNKNELIKNWNNMEIRK